MRGSPLVGLSAPGWYRANILAIFSRVLRPRKLQGQILDTFFRKILDSNQIPFTYHINALPNELTSLNKEFAECVYNCGGWDLNPRFPAYEAGEMTSSLPRDN